MSELQSALAVTGTIIAGGTLLLTIMNGMKKNIIDQLKNLDDKVDERHAENREQSEKTSQFRHDMRELLALKPNYDWIEAHYAKKELVNLELQHLKDAVDEIGKKLDILLNRDKTDP